MLTVPGAILKESWLLGGIPIPNIWHYSLIKLCLGVKYKNECMFMKIINDMLVTLLFNLLIISGLIVRPFLILVLD